MPVKLSDTKIKNLYKGLETQKVVNPGLTLNQEKALQILSAVADKSGSDFTDTKMLAKLKTPGMSQADQIALIKAGMSAAEKKDLVTILDSGTIPLDPAVKAMFEAVLDRTPPKPIDEFEITGDQKSGLSGFAKAGATIEAINLTVAPGGRLHMDDTTVIGKAGNDGKFTTAQLTGDQVMREGDLIRVRARNTDGTTTDWITIHAKGIESSDKRNAVVALIRIGLTDKGNGKVDVSNINESRQVSEPGATLQFTNLKTKEKTQVKINDAGGFPVGFQLNGKPGESFSVAASDGVNNTNFSELVGNVTVPGGTGNTDLIPDPALHKDELDSAGKPRFSKANFTGPLFADGVKAEDVQQGQLGDCYFPAAMAAVAKANPDFINDLIKDNGNGTYTIKFHEKDWSTRKYKDVSITVDGDLWVRSWGGPLYGRSANSADTKKMELWFPLVEKAYAQWKGSYDTIGDGGRSSDVFEAVVGKDFGSTTLTSGNQDRIFENIKKSVDAKLPVAAGTYSKDDSGRYTNTGMYANHAYSVMGYEEANGVKSVILRNPWGESEPAGNGPNDGIFKLKLEDFTKMCRTVYIAD